MGWTVLDVPGVEADDVIGTLAVTAAAQGIEVIVSSGDKDLAQLVDEHITIVDTMNGKRRDLAGVEAEFGVPARLMVDFQTLVGDAVDNVPGVEKVGPKTAAKWLQEYGSLDNIVARAGEIKGVAGENLRKALDWLPTGRALLTVKTDCDLTGWVAGPAGAGRDPAGRQRRAGPAATSTSATASRAWPAARRPHARGCPGSGLARIGRPQPGLFDLPAATSRARTLDYETILDRGAARALAGAADGPPSWWRWTPRPRRWTRCAPRSSA
jgi:DNA polymerase-1